MGNLIVFVYSLTYISSSFPWFGWPRFFKCTERMSHSLVELLRYHKKTKHLSWSLLFWLHAQNQWSSFITCSLKMSIFVWTFVRIFQYSVRQRSKIYQNCAGSRCYSHGICLLKKHYSVPISFLVHLTCTNHTHMQTQTYECE